MIKINEAWKGYSLKVNGWLVFELPSRSPAGLELHVVPIQVEPVALKFKSEDGVGLGDSYKK